MKFAYTILYVEDVLKTIDFYEKAFQFKRKFITPETDYAELLSGETTLSFASQELASSHFTEKIAFQNPDLAPQSFELTFSTHKIHEDFERAVQAGATVLAPPTAKPWGQELGYLRDLNGFLIEVCTPMS